MSIITYYPNIPNGPDNPSYDQPLMQINSQAINSILAVDHITFNVANPSGTTALPGQGSGQHAKVTFNSKNPPGGGNPTDPVSILYTNNIASSGSYNTASASTISEIFYINNSNIFPVSMVKAFGCFNGGGASLNTWNLVVSSTPSIGEYVFSMPTGTVTGTAYCIFISTGVNGISRGGDAVYTINSATSFSLGFYSLSTGALAAPDQFSVMVMQL